MIGIHLFFNVFMSPDTHIHNVAPNNTNDTDDTGDTGDISDIGDIDNTGHISDIETTHFYTFSDTFDKSHRGREQIIRSIRHEDIINTINVIDAGETSDAIETSPFTISPSGNWIISSVPLRLDGFYNTRIHKERDGYTLIDIARWPEWWDQNKRDCLPGFVQNLKDARAALEQAGYVIQPGRVDEDDEVNDINNINDINDIDEILPINPYKPNWREYAIKEPLEISEWVEREGQPAPVVNFEWRALLPAVIQHYAEIHHLFPCKVIWTDHMKDLLKEQIINTILPAVPVERSLTDTVYVQKDITWYPPKPIKGRFNCDLPDLAGDNLNELAEQYQQWFNRLKQDIINYAIATSSPCPYCLGKGWAAPASMEELLRDEQTAVYHARRLRNKRNTREIDKLIEEILAIKASAIRIKQ